MPRRTRPFLGARYLGTDGNGNSQRFREIIAIQANVAADGCERLSPLHIRALLEEAQERNQREHSTAVLLLLWSGTEGALRLLADRESVELEFACTRIFADASLFA